MATVRQAEVMALRTKGLTYQSIGERLGISAQVAWGLANPRRRNAQAAHCRKDRQRRFGAAGRALIVKAKAGGCADCGANPGIRKLDLHHRDPATKEFVVSTFYSVVTRSLSGLDRLRAEIAKCDVLCRSCHAQRHRALKDPDG